MVTQGSVQSIQVGVPVVPRRSFLQLGGTGLALGGLLAVGADLGSHADASQGGPRRRALAVVQDFFQTIQTRSTSAIWDSVAEGGSIEFPFLGAKFTDFASFERRDRPAPRCARWPDVLGLRVRRFGRSERCDRQVQGSHGRHVQRQVIRPDVHHRDPCTAGQDRFVCRVLRHGRAQRGPDSIGQRRRFVAGSSGVRSVRGCSEGLDAAHVDVRRLLDRGTTGTSSRTPVSRSIFGCPPGGARGG